MATTTMPLQLSRIGYRRARQLLSLAGLAILALLMATLLVRSVDTAEVIGTLLFAPIFLLLIFFGIPGGLAGAVGATACYVVLRSDAIDAVGWGEFSGLIVSRSMAYFLFGSVGGWASTTLKTSLDKLDLYDQIDDDTGVNNARFLLQDVDLEIARSKRYQTIFSVSFIEIDAKPLKELSSRKRRTVLREMGRKLDGAVRTIDRVAHGFDGKTHRIATILPETASEGATIFHGRLCEQLRAFLANQGVDAGVSVTGRILTVPGDDDSLTEQLTMWRRIDAAEHAASVA